MHIATELLLVGAALLSLDRLGRWAEDRGWIYWRKRKPDPSSTGNAMLEVQALLEPQKIHVVEERRQEHVQQDDDGGPPRPDPDAHAQGERGKFCGAH